MPPVRHSVALATAVLLCFGLTLAARAEEGPRGMERITLDRIETSSSVLHGMVRLRLFVTAMDLSTGGTFIPVFGKKTWVIEGGGGIKRAPYFTGLYSGADTETAIVFVVQISGEYEADLEAIKQGILEEILPHLPDHTTVGVIGYADDVTAGRLTNPKAAAEQLKKLAPDNLPSESPALLRALDRAIGALKRAKPTVEGAPPETIRKMIVLVSDGRDVADDRNKITRAGKQADKLGIRIHSVAYSPGRSRRALLSLGELSKQSQGTFRWVKEKVDDQSLRRPFKKIAEEINNQYVLTYFVPVEEMPKAKLRIATTLVDKELSSLPTSVKAPRCGENECTGSAYCVSGRCVRRAREEGRGVVGWVLLIGGIGLGILVVLVGVGLVITKVRSPPMDPKAAVAYAAAHKAAAAAAAAAGTPPGAAAAPATGAPAAGAPPAAGYRPVGPQLIILSGPQTGQRIGLHHGFTIGKAAGSNLSLEHDGFASGQHAHILMDAAGNCQLVDKGSTNGSYINGVRITETRLDDGMSIRCGSTELRFLQHG